MPLLTGNRPQIVKANIDELIKANKGRSKPRPRKQILAIALSTARGGKKRPKN